MHVVDDDDVGGGGGSGGTEAAFNGKVSDESENMLKKLEIKYSKELSDCYNETKLPKTVQIFYEIPEKL